MPIYMRSQDAFSLNFTKIGGGLMLKLNEPGVVGFTADPEPTADDAAAVAGALDDLYDTLSAPQQRVLQHLLLQASERSEA